MKIVVLGRGFLGQAFERAGLEVLGRKDVNIDSPNNGWSDRLDGYDVVVNCIGKSDTRWCERHFEEAFWSNANVPKFLSVHCAMHKQRFVHISTGCLYDDDVKDQSESDFLVAHCGYTVTKYAGEKYCSPWDLMIRPRLFFGDFEHKNNLICKLSRFDEFLCEANSFSSVHVIVEAVKALVYAKASGAYNVACDGNASLYQLAKWMGKEGDVITGGQLRGKENLYLVNNTMDTEKLKRIYQPPTLETEFKRCVTKLGV